MELYQIRYFLAVSQTLNFTRAAEDCNVSQPALTRAIQKLESELGGPLFHRERRRTHLTELGRAMVPPLQQSLESAEMAKEQAEGYGRGDIAPLRFGLSETVQLEPFSALLSELLRIHPGLRLELVRSNATDIMNRLENGDLEIAVTAEDGPTWERFDGWPLYSEGFVLCVGRDDPLTKNGRVKADVLETLCLVARRHCENAEMLGETLGDLGCSGDFRHAVDSERDFLTVIANGAGTGIAPMSAASTDGPVRGIPVEGIDMQRTVSLFAVAGRRHTTAATGMIRLARSVEWSP